MVPLKTEEELKKIRQAGQILKEITCSLKKRIKPGIKTRELDEIAERLFAEKRVISAFKGYKGYPANICVSVNEEIVHGIPSDYIVCEGDIVGLDLGLNLDGFYADMAITVPVGRIDKSSKKLIDVTQKALSLGIKKARVGNYLSDISWAIQEFVERNGFSVVRDFVGHGIGKSLHEEPEVPNFGKPGFGPVLKEGMVLAIEPMINLGTYETKVLDNGWTVVTKDGKCSAHFEHTVAITKRGPWILTN